MKENKLHRELEIEEIIDRKLAEMVGEHFKIKQKEEEKEKKEEKIAPPPVKPHHEIKMPLPLKHEFNFDEKIHLIANIFGDESTAQAAIRALKTSPVEIQVIAKLVIDLHEKFDEVIKEYEYRS